MRRKPQTQKVAHDIVLDGVGKLVTTEDVAHDVVLDGVGKLVTTEDVVQEGDATDIA